MGRSCRSAQGGLRKFAASASREVRLGESGLSLCQRPGNGQSKLIKELLILPDFGLHVPAQFKHMFVRKITNVLLN